MKNDLCAICYYLGIPGIPTRYYLVDYSQLPGSNYLVVLLKSFKYE